MAQLIVTATHDYSGETLTDIDQIIFNTSGFAVATFASSQFGGTGISNSVAITGDAFQNGIEVNLSAPGTFSAAGWGFTSWNPAVDFVAIDGTAGSDTLTGSHHGDVLSGVNGTDTLNGGDGDDTIAGGDLADTLNGGNGNDLFSAAGADLTIGETIDGGAGFDTLRVAPGSYDLSVVDVTHLERLLLLGDGTITSDGEFFGNGEDFSNHEFVEVVGVAGGNQALVITDDSVDLLDVAFTNWGGVNQTITINGGGSLAGSAFKDTINGGLASSNFIAGGGGADILNGGNLDDTFRYLAGSDAVAGEVVNAGAGNDALELSFAGNVDFTPIALNSIERIDYQGNDAATFTAAQLASVTAVDGSGSLWLEKLIVGGTSVDLSGITFTNWDIFFDIPFTQYDLIAINGTAGADSLTGSHKDDTFTPGGGADTVVGGEGTDTFRFLAPSDLVAGESLAGGPNNGLQLGDELQISGGGNYDFSPVLVTGMERLRFMAAGTATFAGTQIGVGSIGTVRGSAGADALVVNGSTVNLSNLVFDDSGPWMPGTDTITINGTAGADNLTGSSQNDTLAGGAGGDALTGGAGDDRYVYAPGGGADALNGFVAGAGSVDKADLRGFANLDSFADVLARATQVGANTVIDFGGGDTLTLNNVNRSALHSDDLLLNYHVVNDFNGDARADILWRHSNGTANVFLMDGPTVLGGSNLTQQVDNSWTVQDKADFNGDGRADILWRHQNGTSNVFLMNGQTVTGGSNTSLQVDNNWTVQGAADFNGDGKADILWRHANGTSNVFLMDGATVIGGSNLSQQVDNSWTVQDLGDFNADGRADILWRHQNGTSNVFLMNGSTVIGGSNTSLQVDNSWTEQAVGDFNGDGKADILWRHANGTSNVFLMDGATVVGGSNLSQQVDNNWSVADTGDYNGDGRADILWRHVNGTTNVFLMDGATVLGSSNISTQVDNNWHVV